MRSLLQVPQFSAMFLAPKATSSGFLLGPAGGDRGREVALGVGSVAGLPFEEHKAPRGYML